MTAAPYKNAMQNLKRGLRLEAFSELCRLEHLGNDDEKKLAAHALAENFTIADILDFERSRLTESQIIGKMHSPRKQTPTQSLPAFAVEIGSSQICDNDRLPAYINLRGDSLALVTGTHQTGKTLLLKKIIIELATRYSAANLGFFIAAENCREYAAFSGLPHLAHTPVCDAEQIAILMHNVTEEAHHRSLILKKFRCNKLERFNSLSRGGKIPYKPFPRVICIIDEFPETANSRERIVFENSLATLASMKSYAIGIHVIQATRRPLFIPSFILKQISEGYVLRTENEAESFYLLNHGQAATLEARQCLRISPPDSGEFSSLLKEPISVESIRASRLEKGLASLKPYPPAPPNKVGFTGVSEDSLDTLAKRSKFMSVLLSSQPYT